MYDPDMRKDCPMRGNLGNCSPVGGFCMDAVSDEICEAVHNAYEHGFYNALKTLKEQEPRVMTRLEIEQSEECIVWFEDDQFNSYALVDGIDQRNSWVWLSTVGNMCLQQRRDCENYGKRWRCWTKRPTEDQRKAVKWE